MCDKLAGHRDIIGGFNVGGGARSDDHDNCARATLKHARSAAVGQSCGSATLTQRVKPRHARYEQGGAASHVWCNTVPSPQCTAQKLQKCPSAPYFVARCGAHTARVRHAVAPQPTVSLIVLVINTSVHQLHGP